MFSRRKSAAVLAAAAALTPVVLFGVVGALRSNTNDPRQWLPRGFEETDRYDWLQRHFGNDEITVVSWPGCTIVDERAETLAAALTEKPDEPYFQRATTAARVLRQLVGPPLNVPRERAIERLKGTLIGPDGRTACVVLVVSERGVKNRAAALDALRRAAREECGLSEDELHLGGPTVDAATIDIESQRMLLELAGVSGLVAMAIAWLRLGSLRLTLILLGIAIYCTGVALAILYFTGGTMNLVMTMLPPLVFVLSVSTAIHLVNYYRDAVADGAGDEAPAVALRHGWRPCVVASLTTCLGLLSLAVSEIVPVKMFGIYSGAGVVASLGIVLVLLPAALRAWPARSATVASGEATSPHSTTRIDFYFDRIRRRHAVIVGGCLVLMVAAGTGLLWLRSTVKLQYRFGAESRILQDYRWLEEHLGPLVPMELVVHVDPAVHPDLDDQLRQVVALARRAERLEEVGAAMSAADFAPPLPAGSAARDVVQRVKWRRNAESIKRHLKANHFYADGDGNDGDGGEGLWRISVRASALGDVDYGRFIDTLRAEIEPVVAAERGVRVTYTGVIPLIYKAQRELLSDLTESFLLAFALIAVVVMIVLRSVRCGLLAMIPNIFPVVVVFGLMGWLGIWIEIGSIMTASAAMGIAVDDTFHLLAWHSRALARRGGFETEDREAAVRDALRRCAGAMIHTTVVTACALLVFSFSSFMPIKRFAWLMATLLVAALGGDLVLLPAMLTGPMGKWFRGRSTGQMANAQASNPNE